MHPMCDDLFALPNQDAPIPNLAWHISAEIRSYLTANGYRGEVIDILSREDAITSGRNRLSLAMQCGTHGSIGMAA